MVHKIPVGFSRDEGGGSSLSKTKNAPDKCPNCGEGYIFPPGSSSGDWGKPSSAPTAYCKECGTSYKLMLVEEE